MKKIKKYFVEIVILMVAIVITVISLVLYLKSSDYVNQESSIKINPTPTSIKNSNLIDINKATFEELDTLPGVGEITAKKIIDGRPFEALQELIDKKIINNTTYEKIKDLITF